MSFLPRTVGAAFIAGRGRLAHSPFSRLGNNVSCERGAPFTLRAAGGTCRSPFSAAAPAPSAAERAPRMRCRFRSGAVIIRNITGSTIMNQSIVVGLAMLAGAALGAAAVNGLHAQGRPPGSYAVIDISEITDPE